jgi:peptidoglycan/LPS O-acetylase OafA/YrhL
MGRRATETTASYRYDIQILRGLSVLMVVLYHAHLGGLSGGFIGVDVFFAISGYVITNSLMKSPGPFFAYLTSFYARRVRRLLPVATIVIVATVFFVYHYLTYYTGQGEVTSAIWVALFAGNVHFAAVGTQYLTATDPPSTLQQFWSLAVEEQFYLAWPVIFYGLRSLSRRFSHTRDWLSIIVLALLCVTSLLWCHLQVGQNPSWAFFSPLTRFWEIGVGALLAVVEKQLTILRRPSLGWLSVLGYAVIAYYAFTIDANTTWPDFVTALPVLGAVLVILGASYGQPDPAARLRTLGRPLEWMGEISYSWYLVHWPVIMIATLYSFSPLPAHSRVELALASVAIAALLHYLVENPFRYNSFLAQRKGLTLSLGAVFILLSVLCSLGRLHNIL